MQAVAGCGAIAGTYVASLYCWRAPPWRQHPKTVRLRMLGVLLTCSVAWLPAWLMHKQLAQRAAAAGVPAGGVPTLLQLLGLQLHGGALLAATLRPLLLTALLFLGPLHHAASQRWQRWQEQRCEWKRWQQQQQQQRDGGGGGGGGDAAPGAPGCEWGAGTPPPPLLVHRARDYVVAPVAEEWCFRACMVPLLWMQGWSRAAIVWLAPLFFGACHVHHARELLRAYGPCRAVGAQVALQLAYTSLFGSYAAWVFMASGSIVPAMAVHALCNVLGFPPFARFGRASRALCVAGVLAWARCVARLEDGSVGSAYAAAQRAPVSLAALRQHM